MFTLEYLLLRMFTPAFARPTAHRRKRGGCANSFRVRAETGSNRVNRGGNFNNNAQNVRSANRNNNSPGNRNNNIGVRLVSTGSGPKRRVYGFVSCVSGPVQALILRSAGPAQIDAAGGGW